MIHPAAIVEPGARLAPDVDVGPWCHIGPAVEIGAGTRIGSHVIITGTTRIGQHNEIHPFNSIGAPSQDKKYAGEPTRLEIGDGNVIREFCTINRGTVQGGGLTRVGNENWIMAYVHIAHDSRVGNGAIMANGASLAGHVVVEDFATFGGFTLVHQFCAVGAYSFTAMGSVIVKDVPPYLMVAGNVAKPRGLNKEGLRRHGFDAETMRWLRRGYGVLYKRGLGMERAVEELHAMAADCPELGSLARFVARSSRGIVR